MLRTILTDNCWELLLQLMKISNCLYDESEQKMTFEGIH
ncbi:hypothetical protein BTN49_0558 [Candidatus Enterovibrio escicola]|uniref:Uncharacterized protein n=1 Tax=Candidatus Enterovibrio escicola TaxID=1927127 RepID=A0A2A5T5V7_9GAMM|nr:hypothetical protein BTN49_0558 [Candidatus Enterovibrio escacola]